MHSELVVHWQHHENRYTCTLGDFIAVIAAEAGGHNYIAHIEDVQGNTVSSFWDTFREVEEAAYWCYFSVIEIEQAQDPVIAQARLIETLSFCQGLLPTTIHSSHLQRIAAVKQWVVDHAEQESELRHNQDNRQFKSLLDWQERNAGEFFVNTQHGRAIIQELRPARSIFVMSRTITHQVWIEHSTGAVYKAPSTFIDFMVADAWVQTTLVDLNDPAIAKCYIENVRFTFDILKRVLPIDADPLHHARLEWLYGRMEESLL